MATEANIQLEDLQSPQGDKILKLIHISGQLDESNVDEKVQEIYKVVETNPKNLILIFELSGLDYMNSKSIGYLTDLYGKVSEGGGKVAIVGAKANIVDILQVVGLTQLIDVYENVETAKNKIFEGETSISPTQTNTMQPAPEAPQAVVSDTSVQENEDLTISPSPQPESIQATQAPQEPQMPQSPQGNQEPPVAQTPEPQVTPEPIVPTPQPQPAPPAPPVPPIPPAPQTPQSPQAPTNDGGTYKFDQ